RFEEYLNERSGIKAFDHLPVKPHGAVDAPLVALQTLLSIVARSQCFDDGLSGEFTRIHRQINAGGKNRVHETGSVADANQPAIDKPPVAIREISGRLHCADETGVVHPLAQDAAGLHNAMEDLFGALPQRRELGLVHDTADADLFHGKRDEPEPFVFQPDDDGVAARLALVQSNAGEMAEHREFLQARVDDANALLVAGEIAAAAGVNEKAAAESPGLSGVVPAFNRDEVRARVVEP